MLNQAQGFTLTELLLGSSLVVLVVMGASRLDTTRLGLELGIHQATISGQPNRFEAAFGALRIAESVTRADLVVLTNGGSPTDPDTLQVRYSTCAEGYRTCFNTPDDYVWEQYALEGARLVQYESRPDAACSVRRDFGTEIVNLQFEHVDAETQDPPGGAPSFVPYPLDNNMVRYAVSWSDGVHSQTFSGVVMVRNWGYTDIPEGGLADLRFGDPSPPPPLCSGPAVPPVSSPRSCQVLDTPRAGELVTFFRVIDGERVTLCFDHGGGSYNFSMINFSIAQCEMFNRVTLTEPGQAPLDLGCLSGTSGCNHSGSGPAGRYYVDVTGGTPTGPCGQNSFIAGYN